MNAMQRFEKVLKKQRRTVIGLMSGMSMDGVDLALAEFSTEGGRLKVELKDSGYLEYTPEMREMLIKARSGDVALVSTANVLVAETFAKCVTDFLKDRGISTDAIDAIGSHGQTLFHNGGPATREMPLSTLQVGSPSIIAEKTGIITVGNFRYRDIAAGGKGAPLVAFADYVLYGHSGEPVALNNLGSISNVTVVTEDPSRVIAFDTGPANTLSDEWTRILFPGQHEYDPDGNLAAKGKVIPSLLQELMQIPFIKQAPPKAAGYGDFAKIAPTTLKSRFPGHTPEDYVRTAVEFAVESIGFAYENFVLPKFPGLKRSLFSGGGIYNKTLMRRIAERLPKVKIETVDPTFSDAKEALAFAILGHETLCGKANSLPSATGAKCAVVMGEVAF